MGNYVHRAAQGDALLYRGVSPLRHEGYEYSVPYSTPGPARRYAGKQGYVEVCHPTWRRLEPGTTIEGPRPDLVRAIAEVIRAENGERTLFDGRPPRPEELAEAIVAQLPYEVWRLSPDLRAAWLAGHAAGSGGLPSTEADTPPAT